MAKTIKNHNLLRKHWEDVARQRVDNILRQSKSRLSNVRQEIDDGFRQNISSTGLSGTIRGLAFGPYNSATQRDAFRRLLCVAEEKSDLLEDYGKVRINGGSVVEALYRLASWSALWLQQPADWQPRSHNLHRQFASLSRHLLCEYHVPSFMDSAWFGNENGQIGRYQEWFIWIGTGNNIRKATGLPFPLTKMMAHHFLQAPDSLRINEALRWGQVLGMGGNERLAKAMIGTRLATGTPQQEEFWGTVINFFIRHSDMMDMTQVGPIIDYIYNQKFQPLGQVNVNGTFVHMGPPQPGFCMEKRTVESLINQTEAWHRQLAKTKDIRNLEWQTCGIPGFDRIEGTEGHQRRFLVEEILTSRDLREEGRIMHHCVYSYANSCSSGRTAIFSMKGDHGQGLERRLTIEVNPSIKLITQARGKYNVASNQLDKRIMDAWAMKAGLTYGHGALARWA